MPPPGSRKKTVTVKFAVATARMLIEKEKYGPQKISENTTTKKGRTIMNTNKNTNETGASDKPAQSENCTWTPAPVDLRDAAAAAGYSYESLEIINNGGTFGVWAESLGGHEGCIAVDTTQDGVEKQARDFFKLERLRNHAGKLCIADEWGNESAIMLSDEVESETRALEKGTGETDWPEPEPFFDADPELVYHDGTLKRHRLDATPHVTDRARPILKELCDYAETVMDRQNWERASVYFSDI